MDDDVDAAVVEEPGPVTGTGADLDDTSGRGCSDGVGRLDGGDAVGVAADQFLAQGQVAADRAEPLSGLEQWVARKRWERRGHLTRVQ